MFQAVFKYVDAPTVSTGSPSTCPVLRAHWSMAASNWRQSFMIRRPCDCLRDLTKPGTAKAASSPMIATTIMISTRVKPLRLLRILLIIIVLPFRRSLEHALCQKARFRPYEEGSVSTDRA